MRASSLPVVVAVLLAACELSEPTRLRPAQFGRITAVIREEAWVSRVQPDSVVAHYDRETGRLEIFGLRPDSQGRDAALSLETCGPTTSRAYAFANTWNGPYGPDRLKLGAAADFWLPVDLPGGSTEYYTEIQFGSTGERGDSLVVDEFDLEHGRVRGRFRFHARSRGGTYEFLAYGTFWGRVVSHAGRCALDEA
jgi:hypothetical protein